MEILDGIAKAKENILHLKLDFTVRLPNPKNPAARYSIFVLRNKCGGTHDIAVSDILKDGPVEKQPGS